jgi:hypothetical protein
MAADVESSGEKIVSDKWAHHVRKILSASGSDRDVTPDPQDITQRMLGSQATKNISGADKQDTTYTGLPGESEI